jgi:ComF family protein
MNDADGLQRQFARSPRTLPLGVASFRLLAQRLVDSALDFLFPPRCIGCQRVGSLICASCQASVPLPPPSHEPHERLNERRATAYHAGLVRDAIHAFKYENQPRYAAVLVDRLHMAWQQAGWAATLITAAPLHVARLRERGYNQAALLGRELATRTGLPFREEALRRMRDTRTQVGLNYSQRQMNVTAAFDADSAIVKGQAIILVDDVYTTGATLNACAEALISAGASAVWGLTVAVAQRGDPM